MSVVVKNFIHETLEVTLCEYAYACLTLLLPQFTIRVEDSVTENVSEDGRHLQTFDVIGKVFP
jgi:hypothetical protein